MNRGRILGRNWDKSLRSFSLLAILSHLYKRILLPSPPLSKSGFLKLVCNVNIKSMRNLNIMPRNLNEVVRSWIRLKLIIFQTYFNHYTPSSPHGQHITFYQGLKSPSSPPSPHSQCIHCQQKSFQIYFDSIFKRGGGDGGGLFQQMCMGAHFAIIYLYNYLFATALLISACVNCVTDCVGNFGGRKKCCV